MAENTTTTDKLKLRERIALRLDGNPLLSTPYFQTGRTLKAIRTASPRLAACLLQRRLPEPLELREIFEALGVTYIKLGQFIGSAPSLFPEEYVEVFQDCFDRTETLDFSTVKAVIESELELPLQNIFATIDTQPLASASIAQVHAATLLNGESVVVKVQKPGVSSTIKADLNIVLVMTRILELLSPTVSKGMLSGFVEAIYPYMTDECDFKKEAQYLIEFRRYLQETCNFKVVAPKPHVDFSTSRVLTMQRLHGRSFSDVIRQDTPNYLQKREAFSEAIAAAKTTWFNSLSNHWFFHADLHLGNLMLLDNGTVGFIDFGLVGSIPKKTWNASMALFQGLLAVDSAVIADSLVQIGMTSTSVDMENFQQDIQSLIDVFGESDNQQPDNLLNVTGGAGDSLGEGIADEANRWMMGLAKVARDYGIVFPHAFTLLLKQFLYFDRLGQYSHADSGILDHMDQVFDHLEHELAVLQ